MNVIKQQAERHSECATNKLSVIPAMSVYTIVNMTYVNVQYY